MAGTTQDASSRRRGRPSGKNRLPLSLAERRSRNALYERQRRQETSEAMANLAEAAGCDPSLSSADILATVINQLQAAEHTTNEIEDMKYINAKLMEQIETLEQRVNDEEEEITEISKNKKRKIQSEPKENSLENLMTEACINGIKIVKDLEEHQVC
ncbi:unnamed protein product, partial [Brenthis ino]